MKYIIIYTMGGYMENIIEINDLNFKYKDNIIFENLNLKIEKNTFTTIIGPNDCGKSTLCKILLGFIKADSNIIIDNIKLNEKNIDKIRNLISYIPNNITDCIIMDTVLDEITSSVSKYKQKDLDELLIKFNFNHLLKRNPKTLSGGEQQLMNIISVLLKHPKILIFDKSFSMLDNLMKDKILKMLKKISKEKNITIINITNDIEDLVYGDNIAILSNKQIIIHEKKEILLTNEKLLKNTNLSLPFMAELSKKLSYYDLVNTLELDMNKMINKIWK